MTKGKMKVCDYIKDSEAVLWLYHRNSDALSALETSDTLQQCTVDICVMPSSRDNEETRVH